MTTRKDRQFLAELADLLECNYADPGLNLHDLVVSMKISERQIQRKLKNLTGDTPSNYLRTYRLRKSLEELREGSSVFEVAKAVGFSSQSYFTTCFKAKFGTTPKKYQRTALLPESLDLF